MGVIKLPLANGLTSESYNVYQEYAILRKKSNDFKIWFKHQYSKQDAKCFYCRVSFKGKRINVEHIRPRSKGGDNRSKNLVLACADCNKAKGSKLISKKKIHTLKQLAKKELKASRTAYYREREYQKRLAKSLSWIE